MPRTYGAAEPSSALQFASTTDLAPLDRVRAYYRDLNTGDVERAPLHAPRQSLLYAVAGEPFRSPDRRGHRAGVNLLGASWHIEHALPVAAIKHG